MLGSVYHFNLNGLGRCIISLDRGTVADESEWLGFLKVLLQVGYSCHPLIARKEMKALVPRLRAMPAVYMDNGRICRSPISYQFFRTFYLVHMHFSAVLSLVPEMRSMWECGGNVYVLPSPPLDRAQIPWCRRAMRFRTRRKGSGRHSQLERERSTCRVPSKDESG